MTALLYQLYGQRRRANEPDPDPSAPALSRFDQLFGSLPSSRDFELFCEAITYNGTPIEAVVEESATLISRGSEYRALWESLTVEVKKTDVEFPAIKDVVAYNGREFVWAGEYEDDKITWCLEFRREKVTRVGNRSLPTL